MNEQDIKTVGTTKIKVFKKGEWKTREQIEADLYRLEMSQLRILAEKHPKEFKKVCSEMMDLIV